MINKKNIIVLLIGSINYDSRVQKEISTFIFLGYKVTLVTWNWEPILYNNEKVKIIDIIDYYKVPDNPVSTFWRFIKFWYISANIIKRGNYKYIHCNDLRTLGVVFFLSKKYFKNVIYDAHELYPEMHTHSVIKYKIWNFIEKRLVHKIDIIIVPESNRANYIKQKFNLKTMPYVINNYPKYQKVVPKNLRAELNISNEKKILSYQGAISPDRGIENIIESLRFLPEDFILLLIGYTYGDYNEQIKQLVIERKLENRVFFYGKVHPEEMLQTVAGCDICISLYQNNGLNNYFCASNKVFDSIMAGVKIIANDYPSHSIIKNYEFVGLITQNEPLKIADCIIKLIKVDIEIPENIKRKFSWESFFELFKRIYKM